MQLEQLCAWIDDEKQELFDLLSALIQINSENFAVGGNEAACARYIYDMCQEMGLDSEMYSPMDLEGFDKHKEYYPGHNLENRYNVTARWKGKQDRDELMLMGHIDTVEIGDVANWSVPPLSGAIRDGKIFGRGACDDKYALATVLFLLKLLKKQGFVPRANLVFSAYVDEEHGGSHGALAAVLRHPCPRIVSMDGVEDQIWHCGAGGGILKYSYHTKGIADSAKQTACAIPLVMETIEKFARARRNELEENRFYKGTIIPATALRYMGVRAGDNGVDLGRGEVRFVYYTDKTAEKIRAELDAMEKELTDKLAVFDIEGEGFAQTTRFFHYAYCEPDSEDVQNMLVASRAVTGREPLVCGSGHSDLSVIFKYGSANAYGFGAGRDFSLLGGAHQPDEYIECDKFLEYTKIIAAYILKTLG